MKYADPHACPACRGAISGGTTCPHCAFDLTSRQAHQLWGLFLQADQLVLEGRTSAATVAPVPVAVAAASAGPRPAPVAPPLGGTRPSPQPARSWSTGSLLLALGAVCLVVAGIIFVTVAWGSLGILGRALILLLVTALVGAGAAWATRRRLFGTAEALWGVFLALITVDVLAAVGEGLFGLEWSDFAVVSVFWTVLVVAVGVVVAGWARSTHQHDLVTPQVAAGLAPWISAPAVADRLGQLGDGDHWFWATLVALVLPLAAAVGAHRNRLRWMLLPSGALAIGFVVVLVFLAMGESVDGSPVLTPLEALPTLTLAAAAVVGAVRVPVLRPWLAGFATAAGLWLVGTAVAGWAWKLEASVSAGLVAVAVVVALLAHFVLGAGAWSLGLRWGAVVSGAVPLLWIAGVAFMNLERVDQANAVADLGYSSADLWVGPGEIEIAEGGWVIAVIVPLLAAWWAARRWESPTLAPDAWRWPVAQVAGGAAVVTAVASSTLPFLVHAIVVVVVGAALAAGLRRAPWPAVLVPPIVVAFAMIVVPIDETPVTAWAWGLAAAGFAVCALVSFDDPSDVRRGISAVSAGLGAAAAIATIATVLRIVDVEPDWWATIIAGVAAATLLLTLALDDVPWHRIALEIVAGLALLVALGSVADDLATVALLCVIGAVAAAIVGLLDDDRPHLRWVSVGLVGAAWVARLAASDVGTVEAYTAPFAVALLAAGAWRLHADPASRTWTALTPGLTLGLLPSLPQAIDEPTGLRALLLALVAAVVLLTGVVLRWGAPVVAGAAVLLVLVLVNVGPTAFALQRWILIAIAGVVLLVVGTTWEKRVAEGRALVARIAALR
ncbi:hypothetical protein AFL01nite_23610 [Aeromicrobium flavum]|uniref:DUF2157 domain-containing protein n=1 Tax=Aeromicrobium flavum TaxID=416568 RepID=A0A512HX83_9ACTN|nr:hypothetical protein [Aeromicrobium flavum]GEO90034.1 hypothetical protein AFL01nite_23610 [Aeromicrobium flavum]